MTEGHVRLVEVLGTLSLACDAADGFAHETTMRSAVLAAWLATLIVFLNRNALDLDPALIAFLDEL
jgi:hypothetical protein